MVWNACQVSKSATRHRVGAHAVAREAAGGLGGDDDRVVVGHQHVNPGEVRYSPPFMARPLARVAHGSLSTRQGTQRQP